MTERDYFERQAFAGAPLSEALVIDAHGHLGDDVAIPFVDTSPASLVATMDRMGVDISCVSSIPAIYGQSRRGNDEVLAAVGCFPERLFGYMVVDVGYPERIDHELWRCLAGGMRGVKIHSVSGLPYDHANYAGVYEFAQSHRLPLLAHTWSDAELDQLEPSFARCPEVNFILGHAGAVAREHYVRLARDYDNVYLELCFSACPRGLVEYFVAAGMASRLLWGSDAIFMSAEQQLGRVVFARIAEADKRRILGENARGCPAPGLALRPPAGRETGGKQTRRRAGASAVSRREKRKLPTRPGAGAYQWRWLSCGRVRWRGSLCAWRYCWPGAARTRA